MRSAADCSSSWAFQLSLYGLTLSLSTWILIVCKAPSEAEAQCAELARGGKVLDFDNN